MSFTRICNGCKRPLERWSPGHYDYRDNRYMCPTPSPRPATDEEVNAAISMLRAEGYRVDLPHLGPWEKPIALWRRLVPEVGYTGFYRRLCAFRGEFPKKGTGKRVQQLRTTPELIEWLTRAAEPGRRRDLRRLEETFGGFSQ